jgi:hypothetical protein
VEQKRMAKTQPVPCVVRHDGIAEEDSLAENVQRVALHPLDQFRAFQALRDTGLGEEEIAARFFVSATVVRQRLKLAAVSPKLLDLYAADEMTLDQLMAFAVTDDQARQEQVWENLARSRAKTRMGWSETGKPLDPKSLQKHFALDIGTDPVEANFLVGSLIYATIRGSPPPPGTVAITNERVRGKLVIFWLKDQDGLEGNQRG